MNKIAIETNSINYLNTIELQQYLNKMDDAFYTTIIDSTNIKTATLYIINYLIKHNDTYIKDLAGNNKGNALAIFFNNDIPIDDTEKIKLYNSINILYKTMRLKEIPTFMTRAEYDDVMNERCSLDYVIYDMKTERGRNNVTKQFKGVIYNTAHKYEKCANNEWEEWLGAAHLGFTQAMNQYVEYKGIITKKKNKDYIEPYTVKFIVFVTWWLNFNMLAAQERSHLVHIPISEQKRERATSGSNTWNNTISLNTEIGNDDVDDTVSSIIQYGPYHIYEKIYSNSYTDDLINNADNDILLAELYKYLIYHINKKSVAIFLSKLGLNNLEKINISSWYKYIKNTKDEDINKLYDAILTGNIIKEKQWIDDYNDNKFEKRITTAKGFSRDTIHNNFEYVINYIRHDKKLANVIKKLYYFYLN